MKRYCLAIAGLMILAGVPALAQNGCIDSPENPTALLALAGSAGGVLMALRSRPRGR